MSLVSLTDGDLHALRTRVAGSVIGAADDGFDLARAVWNGMIDRRPSVIVRAARATDVAPTIAFAREHRLDLAVRGGGHNVAGNGNGSVDGGVVLDLGDLTSVDVDPARQTVRVAAGATLEHVDAATAAHGLAVPIGVVSGTGVAGLTLGGGLGWLTRAHGLAADTGRGCRRGSPASTSGPGGWGAEGERRDDAQNRSGWRASSTSSRSPSAVTSSTATRL